MRQRKCRANQRNSRLVDASFFVYSVQEATTRFLSLKDESVRFQSNILSDKRKRAIFCVEYVRLAKEKSTSKKSSRCLVEAKQEYLQLNWCRCSASITQCF